MYRSVSIEEAETRMKLLTAALGDTSMERKIDNK